MQLLGWQIYKNIKLFTKVIFFKQHKLRYGKSILESTPLSLFLAKLGAALKNNSHYQHDNLKMFSANLSRPSFAVYIIYTRRLPKTLPVL